MHEMTEHKTHTDQSFVHVSWLRRERKTQQCNNITNFTKYYVSNGINGWR